MCNSAAIHFNVTAVSVRSQWAILIFHTSPWRAGLLDAQRAGACFCSTVLSQDARRQTPDLKESLLILGCWVVQSYWSRVSYYRPELVLHS